MIEHPLDRVTLEETGSYVPLLEHRDVRHVRELAVLPRQVEDALQGRQLAVDLAVREPPLFAVIGFAGIDATPLPKSAIYALSSRAWTQWSRCRNEVRSARWHGYAGDDRLCFWRSGSCCLRPSCPQQPRILRL